MRGDLPAAAVRLSSALPSRTHQQAVGEYAGRESVNNFRRIMLNGTEYRSLTEASRDLRCCRDTVRKMIDRGEGRYL